MGANQRDQSEMLDAIYSFAVDPGDYIDFTETWDAIVFGRTLNSDNVSLRETAKELELHRHFGRALEVFEKSRLNKQQSVQAFLERQSFASAVCASDGQIRLCNAAFTDHLGLRPGDCIGSISARIEPLNPANSSASQDLTTLTGNEQIAFRYYDQDDSKSLILIEPLEDVEPNGEPQRYLVRSTKIEWTQRLTEFLHSMFKLTQAEAEIARDLVRGHRSDQIANARGSKVGTVRQQIKSIMEKCGSNSQSELMTTMVNLQHLLVARRLVGEKRTIHQCTPTKVHETCVRQMDAWGNLDFEMYGAPDGRPVAFFHSQYSSARPTQAMIEAMASEGLLVFAPRKPGLGDTSIEKQDTDPVGFVGVFVSLMTSFGYAPHGLIGNAMSGVAVVDFAARTPTYQGAVITLNTGIPFIDRKQFDDMPAVPKRVLWTVWDCPELFYAPFAFASQSMLASDAGETAFVDDQYKDIPHDLKLIEDPFFYELARIGMRDFMSTPKRSADELVYWVHDWTDALLTVSKRLPVLFLQSDQHDFLDLETTQDYLAKLGTPKFSVVENAAQLCLFEKPEVIAEQIGSFLGSSNCLAING